MIPRDDEARAKQVKRVLGYARLTAALHDVGVIVVAEPPPSEIERVENQLPYYVLASEATPWERANGRLIEPE